MFLEKAICIHRHKFTISIIIFTVCLSLYLDHKLLSFSIISNLSKVQNGLFALFFAVGSFLFTLMNIFLFTIKEKIFDLAEYKKEYNNYIKSLNNQEIDYDSESTSISRYAPLESIANLFIYNIKLCFVTSLLFILLSFFNENTILHYFPLGFACTSFFYLLYLLFFVEKYIKKYFELIKKEEILEKNNQMRD